MMNKSIRVLVAIYPRLMRELILTTFADQPDIEVVGEVTEESAIPGEVERTSPDFLVISLNSQEQRPQVCDTVLLRRPEMRIIAVDPEHNYSVHYWVSLKIQSNDVEASEEGILGVIRNKGVSSE
jgi:chemotaxis response regulator CheB